MITFNQTGLTQSPYQHILYEIADRLGVGIYVTDAETDELLFMSRSMREAYGVTEFHGLRCWELLQRNIPQRCDFCPIRRLTGRGAPPFYLWEEVSPVTGRHYENFDGLIPWLDGRKAHFQYSVDVTDINRSYAFSNVDETTRTLNRTAGLEILQNMLEDGRDSGRALTLCLFDVGKIDGEAVGHDDVTRAVFAVKSVLSVNDFIFRLTDGEFVVVLPGQTPGQAATLLAQADALLLLTVQAQPLRGAFRHSLWEVPLRNAPTAQEALSMLSEVFLQTHRRESGEPPSAFPMPQGTFSYHAPLLYDALVQSSDAYLFLNDVKSGAFRFPPAMVREFDLPGEIILDAGDTWVQRLHPHDQAGFAASYQDILNGTADSHCLEYRVRNYRSEWVWLRCRGHLQRDAQGKPALFAGFITNLDKRNRQDRLTGLPNKLECEDEIARLLRTGSPMALLMLGLDNLRRVNSLYDRAFGDEVIRMAAASIQSLLPTSATVYRMDGDEFAVILRMGWRDAAERLYHELQRTFDRQQSCDGKLFYCTLSCGCTLSPRDTADEQKLLKYAHIALGCAKAGGKNQICCFSQELLRHQERSLRLTELLRESAEHGFPGFELHYQPLYCTSIDAVGAAEALCRWHCQEYGQIPPMEFIPLLEETGLIHRVGRWIFYTAAETARRWQMLFPGFRLGVNLSYLQLEDPDFLDYIKKTLSALGVDPDWMVLELTESHLAANISMVSDALVELRAMGFKIAMDDFGTGYSSLGLLRQHPIDIVKIDRSFIASGQSDHFDNAFLRFACDLCHSIGVQVCVEGVETLAALDLSTSLRVDYVQGYYYSRPIPAAELEQRYLMNL